MLPNIDIRFLAVAGSSAQSTFVDWVSESSFATRDSCCCGSYCLYTVKRGGAFPEAVESELCTSPGFRGEGKLQLTAYQIRQLPQLRAVLFDPFVVGKLHVAESHWGNGRVEPVAEFVTPFPFRGAGCPCLLQ